MPAPVDKSYVSGSGQPIYGGRVQPPVIERFDSVSEFSSDANAPFTTLGQVMVLQLHASSGSNYTAGKQYRAVVSGYMAKDSYTTQSFYTARTAFANVLQLRPMDNYAGANPFESMHLGYKFSDGLFHLITKRRVLATYQWALDNLPYFVPSKTVVAGGSMGGWGTLNVGLRRPDLFAAMYPDRPRWKHSSLVGKVGIPVWGTGFVSTDIGAVPNLAPQDGGGSVMQALDHIAYVANTANEVNWIGWCVGWNDGFTPRADHVAAVAALRSAKRGFAFAWNNGDHGVGSIPSVITDSYPYGTFEIGKGYPLFTNHSADGDPAVDLEGGINIGLSFRNVVESASAWSCEVTSIAGARTVDVEPKSKIFVTPVAAKAVTIPAANSWVAVSFTA